MAIKDFYRCHELDDTVARVAGFNPYFPEIRSGLSDPLLIGEGKFINLASNNYLGLANDERLKKAAVKGIEQYGVSMCATPIASGYSELFKAAEASVSGFCGLEDSMLYPSCYQANNGLFKCIAGQEDMIIFDRNCHSSLIEGIRTAASQNRPFRHNDLSHLESVLKRTRRHQQVFVVTESVFSTEGAVAPFADIYDLCLHYGAIPVVDDSHGIGVIGKQGRGILEHAGLSGFQGIYTASLGKAMAVNGGVVSGRSSLIRFLRFSSSHLIYSTALNPASLNALLKVLEIVREEFPLLSSVMWDHSRRLKTSLEKAGFILTESQTPILSICPGNSVETLIMTRELYQQGILTTPFIYPSVPENCGRIRLIAGANLSASTIEKACAIFENLKENADEMLPRHKPPRKRRKGMPAV